MPYSPSGPLLSCDRSVQQEPCRLAGQHRVRFFPPNCSKKKRRVQHRAWNHLHHFTCRAAEICHLSPGASIGRKKAPSTNKSDSPPSWARLCQWGESRWSACTARWFYRWWTESSDWLRLRCLYSPGRRRHWEYVGGRRGARCHKTENPNHFHRRLKDTKTDRAHIVSSLEQNYRDLK